MPLNSTEPKGLGDNLNVEQKNGHVMVHCPSGKLCSNKNEAVLHDTKLSLTEEERHKRNTCA